MYITNAVELMKFSPNILKKFHMFLTSNWCRAIVNVFVGHVSLIICGAWVDTPDTLLDLPDSPVFLFVITDTLCSQYFPIHKACNGKARIN